MLNLSKNMNDNIASPEEYDVLVLGSGEGAKNIAWTSAKQGKSVAVIERKYIGGSCPNIACLPSKNIIQSAKVASYFYRSGEFGITKDNCRINMPIVHDRKRKMVDELIKMHLEPGLQPIGSRDCGSARIVAASQRHQDFLAHRSSRRSQGCWFDDAPDGAFDFWRPKSRHPADEPVSFPRHGPPAQSLGMGIG